MVLAMTNEPFYHFINTVSITQTVSVDSDVSEGGRESELFMKTHARVAGPRTHRVLRRSATRICRDAAPSARLNHTDFQ